MDTTSSLFHVPMTDAYASRPVLRDISDSPLSRGVHSESNVGLQSEMYQLSASPDEFVIKQRGHRHNLPSFRLTFSPGTASADNNTVMLLHPASSMECYSPREQGTKRAITSVNRMQNLFMPKRLRLDDCCNSPCTKKQLPEVVTQIMFSQSMHLSDIVAVSSIPDLQSLEKKLAFMKKTVYRSFPSFRWEASYNAISFRRVRIYLDMFKKVCIGQLKQLVSCQCWKAVIQYVITAWRYVHELPNWDDPAHNKTKSFCFRYLATQCLKAIVNATFMPSELADVRQKLVRCCELSNIIVPCIKKIDKLIEM